MVWSDFLSRLLYVEYGGWCHLFAGLGDDISDIPVHIFRVVKLSNHKYQFLMSVPDKIFLR